MKNYVVLFLCLLFTCLVNAQVVIQLQAPPLGMVIKPQLWNLSLVNGSKEALNVRIEMTMTDIRNNQRILTATTRSFILPGGAKQVQVKDVVPVVYNSSGAVTVDPNPDGFLPAGVFNICYYLIGGPKGAIESSIGEACETFEIEALSPPQLVSPADKEKITNHRPLFTWLPPAPLNSFNQLKYDFTLVEVMPTQSPADAIQMNIPLHTRQQLTVPNLQYPQSSPVLDTGKIYAWRVSAKNNQVIVSNSEITIFTVSEKSTELPVTLDGDAYGRLYPTEDGGYILCKGLLRFEFNNENNQQKIHYKIYELSKSLRKVIDVNGQNQTLKMGQNLLQIDLKNIAGISPNNFYLLEVTEALGKKWYLRFEYRK